MHNRVEAGAPSVLCGRGVVARTKDASLRCLPRIPLFPRVNIFASRYGRCKSVAGRSFFMKKTKKSHLKLLVALSLMSALSIVLGKYLAFNVGTVLRFSFENLPIIFSGLAFGPAAGGAVALVADLVGCLLVGYEINPVVTLGAVIIGVSAGFCRLPFATHKNPSPVFLVLSAELISHLLGSVIVKTIGLSAYYDMPFLILMAWRLLNYLIIGILEGTMIYVLLKNPALKKQINSIKD